MKKFVVYAAYVLLSGLIATTLGAEISIVVGGDTEERIVSWGITSAVAAILLGAVYRRE